MLPTILGSSGQAIFHSGLEGSGTGPQRENFVLMVPAVMDGHCRELVLKMSLIWTDGRNVTSTNGGRCSPQNYWGRCAFDHFEVAMC